MTTFSEQASMFASRPDAHWHTEQIRTALSAYQLQRHLNPHQARELAATLRARLREDTETAEQQERSQS